MVLFNYSTKELTAKVVYYGPGLCGKTTNLQWIHEKLPIRNKGKMLSLATETDRTLFFDFLPIELGSIRGMKTRIQLYTVPGQVFYNATRRMVLKGADGVVFVCDSQEALVEANLESLENLKENLVINEIDPDSMPIVLQYNKRDLPNAAPLEILNERLNPKGWPTFEASAIKGIGVEETLKGVTAVVFRQLSTKYGGATAPGGPAPAPPAPRPVAVAPPPPPEPEPEPMVMSEPEPMVMSEPEPVAMGGADDLLDEFDTSAPPEPPPMEELQMSSEPELQLDVPVEPALSSEELTLDEEPSPFTSGNPSSTVMADPDETAALRARLASAAPPPEDEFPMETMEELPPVMAEEPPPYVPPPYDPPAFDEAAPFDAPASEEPPPYTPPATIEASASVPLTVDASSGQADVAIPLQITLQGQTTQVQITLRLTIDLKQPR